MVSRPPGTFCSAGRFTKLAETPTWGFTYIWVDRPVTIQWKRYASGIPWYSSGTKTLRAGKNTLVHGGPALYCRIDVKPSQDMYIRWS